MSALKRRCVNFDDVHAATKNKKVLVGKARGGSKKGKVQGAPPLWHKGAGKVLKEPMIQVVKKAAQDGAISAAKVNHHLLSAGGGNRPSGAGQLTLANVDCLAAIRASLKSATSDSTNLLSLSVEEVFSSPVYQSLKQIATYRREGKYKDQLQEPVGEIIEAHLFGLKRKVLGKCLRNLVGNEVYKVLGIDGNCTFVACSMGCPLHTDHLKLLFAEEGHPWKIGADGSPEFPADMSAEDETRLMRNASEEAVKTLETGRLSKERVIQMTEVLPAEIQVMAEKNGSYASPKTTFVVSFETTDFDEESLYRGGQQIKRGTIRDSDGETKESCAGLFLRNVCSSSGVLWRGAAAAPRELSSVNSESSLVLREYIQTSYNETTGAAGTDAERTFTNRYYNMAIKDVFFGGVIKGERWRTCNVCYG